MKFEYLQGDEVLTLALKLGNAIPKETSNRTILGAFGSIAATVLSELFTEEGEELLAAVLTHWGAEIAAKATVLAKLKAENFDFEAWAATQPTAGEA